MKTVRIIIMAIIVCAAVGAAAWWYVSPPPQQPLDMKSAVVSQIEPMVRLSSIELYRDLPVKATIGKRHLVARLTAQGAISFDLDKLQKRVSGDSLLVTLPPEIVEVHESTQPNAYEVIDTWSDKFLGSSQITAAEENIAKLKTIESYKRSLYLDGTVRRARAEAKANITALMHKLAPGVTVLVTDPTPNGVKSPGR